MGLPDHDKQRYTSSKWWHERKSSDRELIKLHLGEARIQTVPKAITEQAPTLAPPPSEVGESSDLNERNLSAAP
nr:hypothetical protein Iba_chr08bCG12440 [Ipomoea batatas]